jgi:hypothetical protein
MTNMRRHAYMDSACKGSLGTGAGVWQRDEMDREIVENGTTGTVGFFNVDGLRKRCG